MEATAGALLPIVTLWETYGSRMSEISEKLACELGVPVHRGSYSSDDPENLDGAEHPGDSWYLVQARGRRGQTFRWGRLLDDVERQTASTAATLRREVQEDAKRGGVFMGRNGTIILKGYPNALHVKLDGPLDERLAYIMRWRGVSRQAAVNKQRFEDEVRSQMALELFDWDPLELDHFDLVLNTAQLSDTECVTLLAGAVRAKIAALG